MKVLIIGNRSHQFIYNYVKTLKKVYLNSDLEIDILSQDSSDLSFPCLLYTSPSPRDCS